MSPGRSNRKRVAPLGLSALLLVAAACAGPRVGAESSRRTAAPARPLVLIGATLNDGTGGPALPDSVVVIEGDTIRAVCTPPYVVIPADAEVVDLTGRHLTPGLIDTHVHYSQTGWADGRPDARDLREDHPYEEAMADNEAHPERFHRAFLHAGITAVFDVGGYPWTRRLGAATESDPWAPHVAATGALLCTYKPAILDLPDRSQFVLMEDEAQVRAAVRSHAAAGSDAIKVWFLARPPGLDHWGPLVHAAGDEARRAGLPLVVHATSLETARIAVAAGAHLLVHSVGDRPVDEAFVAAIAAAGTFYCPTLIVQDGYTHLYRSEVPPELEAQLDAVHPSVAARIRATAALPRDRRYENPRIRTAMDTRRRQQVEVMAGNLRALRDAGVPIVLGTDAGNPLTLHGPSVFTELEAMAAAGMTPAEVLRAATADAARAMGRGGDLGQIAPGYAADLLVLPRDPTADVGALRELTHVMRGGVLRPRQAFRQTRGDS